MRSGKKFSDLIDRVVRDWNIQSTQITIIIIFLDICVRIKAGNCEFFLIYLLFLDILFLTIKTTIKNKQASNTHEKNKKKQPNFIKEEKNNKIKIFDLTILKNMYMNAIKCGFVS
jgi:hypothetical protein